MLWLFSIAVNVRKILEIWHPQRNKSRSTIISVSVLYINTSLWQSWKDSQGLRTCGIRVFTQAGKLSNVYFQVIFDCENVWLPSGHSRAQPPLRLTQDMPCLTWKLSGTDRMQCQRQGEIRSSSATLLEHGEVFCISAENRIFPLMQFVGSLLGKIEMRGEGGCHRMLRKWLSVKKSVITLTKQILFGWKLLGLEMTKTAPAG